MATDIFVKGEGRAGPGKKVQPPKIDNTILENDKMIEALKKNVMKKMKYTTLDTTTLTSALLQDNEVFNGLKAEIERFNELVRKALFEKRDLDSYNWRLNLYSGLRNLLKEVVGTESREMREKLLDKACNWFYDKLAKKDGDQRPDTKDKTRPITAATRPGTTATQPSFHNVSGISPNEGDLQGSPKKNITDPRDLLPSEFKAEILKDYEIGARSKHEGIEPPYERINEYERKVPNGILKPTSSLGTRAGNKSTTFAEEPKPFLLKPKTPEKKTEEEEGLGGEEDEKGGEEGEGGEGGEGEGEGEGDGEGGEAGEGGEGASKPEGETKPERSNIMMPARRLYTNDRYTGFVQPLKDKTIPIETRSAYTHYVPSGENYELALEQRWRNSMNKKLMEKREREEMIAVMKQWSHAKGRLDEEINRKNESMTFGSKFQVRSFNPRAQSAAIQSTQAAEDEFEKEEPKVSSQPKLEDESPNKVSEEGDDQEEDNLKEDNKSLENNKSQPAPQKMVAYYESGYGSAEPRLIDYSKVRPKSVATGLDVLNPPVKRLENEITKSKIDRIKKLHGDLIFQPRGTVPDVGQDGSHAVNRPTSLSIYDNSNAGSYRPFSAVYQKTNPEVARKAQIQEIEDIKKKLAKFKIKVPVKTLQTSILLPELKPEEKKVPLPEYGSRLMMNPFFKEKKKKGGKKKKK